ncbi:MAG: hypothetical protein HC892_17545 [Saprospiraceae bacterium]|nr:hypothetical protein [Saprospiraceae bacterium]
MLSLPDSTKKNDAVIKLRASTQQLYNHAEAPFIASQFDEIKTAATTLAQNFPTLQVLQTPIQHLEKQYTTMQTNTTLYKHWIPAIHWHGIHNQYHQWMNDFLHGDLGISLRDYRPVKDKIREAIFWTAIINLSALVLAYLFAIPLGVWSAVKKDTFIDKSISLLLFLLYSLPTFWIATLLIVFLRPANMAWIGSLLLD